MPVDYQQVQAELREKPRRWLVTGAAGFIGSNLCHKLLELNQAVTGLDNYSNGLLSNTLDLQKVYPQYEFIEGDLRDIALLQKIVPHHDHILHQAALGSVPRSLNNPLASHDSNVNGFLNLLDVCRVNPEPIPIVYASSSSVYGDHPGLPKLEDIVGQPLSPYAATKTIKEIYARVFAQSYGLHLTGLRYFNVFGPRQNPEGAYAAVIPRWIRRVLLGEPIEIYGDGETSRDFCYIANAVQANILAAFNSNFTKSGEVYNIAAEKQTTLNQLYQIISQEVSARIVAKKECSAVFRDFRPGDVRHSLASVGKAKAHFNYRPSHSVEQGLAETVSWFVEKFTSE